jgi:acetylcholinesterase
MWGQSAGAISADNYNFAYPDDPIVAGFIMHSGTAMLPLSVEDPTHTNFTFVAEHFDCTDADPDAQVDCLRNVSASDLVGVLKGNVDSAKSPFLAFGPVIDNRTQFANYTGRASTRKPAIIGTTTNEGVSFVSPYNQTYGPDQSLADAMTILFFQCPTTYTIADRYANNLITFRYVYAGNFSNIAPQWWEGAYHSSDLPLIFGTYGIARGNGTHFQKQVSEKMQDMWVAFAEDPVNGLPNMGWNKYQGGSGEALLIGKGELVTQPIAESALETICY